MLKTKLRGISLLVLALVLAISVFSMTAFADEPAADGTTAADTAAATDETGAAADETGSATDETADDGHDHDDEEIGFGLSDLVSLIILGAVVIAVTAYCIVKREKVGRFFKSLRSEFKKISWSTPEQVRKNTIVVLVVVISLAVVIGLLDLLFNTAISSLSVLL